MNTDELKSILTQKAIDRVEDVREELKPNFDDLGIEEAKGKRKVAFRRDSSGKIKRKIVKKARNKGEAKRNAGLSAGGMIAKGLKSKKAAARMSGSKKKAKVRKMKQTNRRAGR